MKGDGERTGEPPSPPVSAPGRRTGAKTLHSGDTPSPSSPWARPTPNGLEGADGTWGIRNGASHLLPRPSIRVFYSSSSPHVQLTAKCFSRSSPHVQLTTIMRGTWLDGKASQDKAADASSAAQLTAIMGWCVREDALQFHLVELRVASRGSSLLCSSPR